MPTDDRAEEKRLFDLIEVGKPIDAGTVVVTQAQINENRRALDWPEAPYPVLHLPGRDETPDHLLFPKRVNARSIRHFHNPPIPGKKIKLTQQVSEKYYKGDTPYAVELVEAYDEDGRHIETMIVHQLLRTKKVGEKWS